MRTVSIDVVLPDELAAEVEELQLNEPTFLPRIISFALTRRHVALMWRDQDALLEAQRAELELSRRFALEGDHRQLRVQPTPFRASDPGARS